MDKENQKQILDKSFSNLTLFYRDTNLFQVLIDKYHIGQIIVERAFTDMTYKGSGLATNFRYLIASSEGRDLGAFSPDAAKCGLIVLNRNAFFKVLDIYKIGDKTQVLLLNFPEHAVEVFRNLSSDREAEIIRNGRLDFEDKVNAPLIEELQLPYWTERTKFPIGMSDDGVLFLDETI